MASKITFLTVVAVALLIDLILYVIGGYSATITYWIRSTPEWSGIVGFMLGALFGHLFLGTK